jgi:hypothetical protein
MLFFYFLYLYTTTRLLLQCCAGAIDAILVANRTIYGTEANQISFLFWLMYTSAADGLMKICEAKEFTAQEGTIKVVCVCVCARACVLVCERFSVVFFFKLFIKFLSEWKTLGFSG